MPELEDIISAIKPVKVKHLPEFLKSCEPIATHLMQGDLVKAFVEHTDCLVTATILGADVDRAWLEDQTVETLMELAFRVVEVNTDFFARSMLPRITGAASVIGRMIPDGGTSGLPGLSDTASPTDQ